MNSSDDDLAAWVAPREAKKNMVTRDGAAGIKGKCTKLNGMAAP